MGWLLSLDSRRLQSRRRLRSRISETPDVVVLDCSADRENYDAAVALWQRVEGVEIAKGDDSSFP
jgi:hypothetical protein